VTAYGVLSRGLLTGSPIGKGDNRAHMPRFAGDNRAQNQRLVDALARLAQARGVTPAQLAIAWVRAKKPYLIPTLGSRTRAQLDEALGALAITLDARDIASLEDALPAGAVAGTRYAEAQMKNLDSER